MKIICIQHNAERRRFESKDWVNILIFTTNNPTDPKWNACRMKNLDVNFIQD